MLRVPALADSNPFDNYVPLLGVGGAVPQTAFVDQLARRVTLADFRGQTLIVAFIYTNCTDACPLISAKYSRLQSMLAGGKFHLIEVSIDPARDTPKKIGAYARRFHADPARWSILTGSQAGLNAFWRAMGESVIPGTHGEVIHNDRTIIVGPDGAIGDIIDEASWSPDQVAAQARHLAGESSSPLARLDLAVGKAVAFVCGGFQSGHAGLGDVLWSVVIVGGFSLILYLLGRKFFALPN
jgi:protein SCO1